MRKKKIKKEDTGSPVQGNCTSERNIHVRVTYSHFAVRYNFNAFPNDETFLTIILQFFFSLQN